MSQHDDDAIAAFIRASGVTRCPTACVAPTQAVVAAADRLALSQLADQREVCWQARRGLVTVSEERNTGEEPHKSIAAAVSPACRHRDQQSFTRPLRMTRQTFAQKLAVRILAREGMTAIWELHVAAAEAYQRGQSSVAAMLIEIADGAEREWLLCCHGMSGRGKVQIRPMY